MDNLASYVGAAVVGVIGVAGLLLVEYLRQEKQHEVSNRNVRRLEQELSELRLELRQLQEKKNKERIKKSHRHSSRRAHSVVSSSDGTSNLDSSDIEFYDCSEDEESSSQLSKTSSPLEAILTELDKKLDLGDIDDIEQALEKLEDLCLEYPNNPELLYRIAKAHHKVADESDNLEFFHERLAKGLAACSSALSIDPEHGDVHKWYAVLIGSKSNKTSDIKEKINGGFTFKKHVDKAISLKPNDYSLHYMLGRFQYEIAGLRWYERKVAAALYSDPPYATYEEAFACFEMAERLSPFEWKENRLMMGKCKIAMSEYREAVQWLEKANGSHATSLDKKVDLEIKELLRSYNSYK